MSVNSILNSISSVYTNANVNTNGPSNNEGNNFFHILKTTTLNEIKNDPQLYFVMTENGNIDFGNTIKSPTDAKNIINNPDNTFITGSRNNDKAGINYLV